MPFLALIVIQDQLEPYITIFVDNQLLSQLSRKVDANLFVYFDWVPSELNVSRQDDTDAADRQWNRIDRDLTPVFDILTKAADDTNYALFMRLENFWNGGVCGIYVLGLSSERCPMWCAKWAPPGPASHL